MRRRDLLVLPVLLFSGLLGVPAITLAQQGPPGFAASQADLEQYLRRKYVIEHVMVLQSEAHRPWDARRSLRIRGTMVPRRAVGRSARTDADARAIAEAFFAEEASLFGLTPASEMRQEVRQGRTFEIITDPNGDKHIRYEHYLKGLRLLGTWTIVHINPAGHIDSVEADVVPISPELLAAVAAPTLPESRIRQVVKKDLEAAGLDPGQVEELRLEKAAIAAPPYVVWLAETSAQDSWHYALRYTIDGFTGRVIEKRSRVQTLH